MLLSQVEDAGQQAGFRQTQLRDLRTQIANLERVNMDMEMKIEKLEESNEEQVIVFIIYYL